MGAILESPPRSPRKSVADLAVISQQLAEDVGRLGLQSEGFTIDDYLSLDGNYLVEYADGCIQVLPMPSDFHQLASARLHLKLAAWAALHDPRAHVRYSPIKVRVSPTRFREPDLCVLRGIHANRRRATHWESADLVVEIVSDSNRDHDTVTKRAEYAAAGIPEYWIVDPDLRTITVLVLRDGAYVLAGEYGPGRVAIGVELAGFTVDVGELFADAEPPPPG